MTTGPGVIIATEKRCRQWHRGPCQGCGPDVAPPSHDGGGHAREGQWHTLEASAHGSKLTVTWDGAQVIQAEDKTFTKGKIGIWTKADSVTAFDDLEATAE